MNEINRVLRIAAWRVGCALFLRGLVLAVAAGLGALILTRLAQQFFGFAARWDLIGYGAGAACVITGIVYALVVRPDRLGVARRVDEGANLREALSTALCVAGSEDPWARATVESASRQSRGVRVNQAVPIAAPRFWPVLVALGLTLGIVFLAVPKFDFLGWRKQQAKAAESRAQIFAAKTEAVDAKKKVEEMVKDLDLGKEKAEALAPPETPEIKDPEAIRKAAIKDLTKLSDRLEQLRSGEKAQKLDALSETLKQLKAPGAESAELSKALATGNFKQAQQEIEKIKEAALGKANLSDADKQKLAKQMDDLAKQLDKLADNKKAMEKQLEQMGMDKSLASDPAALQKALENAKNLTEQQKQQIAEMARSMKESSSSCQGLSQAMSKMGEALKSGDPNAAQQAAQGAKGQLSDLEQISQDMQMADAAMNECKSQMVSLAGKCNGGDGTSEEQGPGSGPWSESWNQRQGGGRGGGGLGKGGSANWEKADFDTEKRKAVGSQGSGPIVGSRMVQGESIKGESKAEFAAAVASAEQRATEAIENNTIPREFHEAVKAYFGRLKEKGAPKAEVPAEPAKPAPDAGKK